MNQTMEQFKLFMANAFPDVRPDTRQWIVMELVWFSASLWSAAETRQNEETGFNIITESFSYCDHVAKEMIESQQKELNNELN